MGVLRNPCTDVNSSVSQVVEELTVAAEGFAAGSVLMLCPCAEPPPGSWVSRILDPASLGVFLPFLVLRRSN